MLVCTKIFLTASIFCIISAQVIEKTDYDKLPTSVALGLLSTFFISTATTIGALIYRIWL